MPRIEVWEASAFSRDPRPDPSILCGDGGVQELVEAESFVSLAPEACANGRMSETLVVRDEKGVYLKVVVTAQARVVGLHRPTDPAFFLRPQLRAAAQEIQALLPCTHDAFEASHSGTRECADCSAVMTLEEYAHSRANATLKHIAFDALVRAVLK